MGMVFLEGVALQACINQTDGNLRDPGANAPGDLEWRPLFVIARPRRGTRILNRRAGVSRDVGCLVQPLDDLMMRQFAEVERIAVVHQNINLGFDAQLGVLDGVAQAGTQGRTRRYFCCCMNVVHLDGIVRRQIAMRVRAHLMVVMRQFGGGQRAIVFEPGAIAVAVAIPGVGGKFPALVLGVLVEMDIAEVRCGMRGGRLKRPGVATRNGIDITRRLRTKARAIGVFGEHVALLFYNVVRCLFVPFGRGECDRRQRDH